MRLPENTVDAWTAISLAQAGAQWIWLPTTNQQSARAGDSPWDLEACQHKRLLIIENKGIVGNTSVNLGQNTDQRRILTAVEEVGLNLIPQQRRPRYGWVLYGLPLLVPDRPTDGTTWIDFPHWHHFACPHDLDLWNLPATGQRTAKKIVNAITHRTDHIVSNSSLFMPAASGPPLTLGWYGHLMSRGLIGLPLPANSSLIPFLRHLVLAARSPATGFPDDSLEQPDEFEPSPAILLAQFLSELAADSRHLIGVVN